MTQPEHGVPQIMDVSDIFTTKGEKTRFSSFIAGRVVKGKEFVGRDDVLAEVIQQVSVTGISAIESGYRCGRTSFMAKVGKELVDKGSTTDYQMINLQEGVGNAQRDLASLQTEAKGSVAIAVDEVPPTGVETVKFMQSLGEAKSKGHKIVVALVGDFRTHPEYSDDVRASIANLVGGNVTALRSMTDTEIRKILNIDGRVFTPAIVNYLVKEAGGNAMLAQLLAQEIFGLGRGLKEGWTHDAEDIIPEMKEKTLGNMGTMFGQSLELAKQAGYDPLTCTMSKPGDAKVYVNMFPRLSSTIFRKWLAEREIETS